MRILLLLACQGVLAPHDKAMAQWPQSQPATANSVHFLPASTRPAVAPSAFAQTWIQPTQPGGFSGALVPVHSSPVAVRGEIGVIGLMRETPNSQVLAIDENSIAIFNASELQGSMQFGLRATVDILRVSPAFGFTDLQLGYFGVNSLDAETTLASAAVSPIFFNSVPVSPEPTSNIIYSSNLYSGEVNLRLMSTHRFRPIIGLRYFKLEDTYDTFNHATGPVNRLGGFSQTNNSLFGGQFGGEADLLQYRYCRVYASGKFGVMNNQVEGNTRAANAAGAEVQKDYGASSFSTLVDARVGIEFSVSGPLFFRIDYQILHAGKVALGVDQNESVNLLSPGETVVFNSQQWNGLNLSTVWEF